MIALLVIVALWPWPKWQRMCARLPRLLAIPHVAFATSALLLFADGGLLMTISRISPATGSPALAGPPPSQKEESAFLLCGDSAGSIERKTAVAAGHCADSLGAAAGNASNYSVAPLRRTCTGNGDVTLRPAAAVGWRLAPAAIHRRWQ